MMSKDLSIIIVNYNTRSLLTHCLDSITKYTKQINYEIIVIDNGSTDGSVEELRDNYRDKIIFIDAGKNLGFGVANNLGFRSSTGKILLFLNSDTEIFDDVFSVMFHFIISKQDCAICCPQLIYPDFRDQFSYDTFITPWKFFKSLGLKELVPRKIRSYFSHNQDKKLSENLIPFVVERPRGACFMIRRDVFESSGMFDPRFFMFCEEVDLSRRVMEAGWKNYFLPMCKVIHHWGGSTAKVSATIDMIHTQSNYKYFEKYYGLKGVLFLRSLYCFNFLIKLAGLCIGGLFGLYSRREMISIVKARWRRMVIRF
ncbi:glycosyltransferase family 2 protein [bacterium]|nr:glycosyltransferase family 2 protein [candidate division CSSED10-310 bacterium]